jgi:transglutaminase-like putative cysteine protease
MMIFTKGRSALVRYWLLLAFISTSISSSAGAQPGYTIAPLPAWVTSVEAPRDDWVEKTPGGNGVAYLLVDRQWSMSEGKQRFHNHFATKAVSPSGVEEASAISIEFDPLYESLTLHGITVWRDGKAMQRLERARIDLIQREKELEYQLYSGSKTLNVILKDVRPGDTVEYSYTIEGANPIFAGHFSSRVNLQWTVPVGRVHYRVLWPDDQPLYVRNYKTAVKPRIRSSDGRREMVWLHDRVEAAIGDGNTPSWFDPIAKISMSDMSSWDQVVEWALPLYRQTPVSQAEREILTEITQPGMSKAQQLLAVLNFVQQQIRYLGMEMGESSHRPSLPEEVLDRRYGDCKDKTRLLISLLRELRIEAYPALVNSASGDYLPDALPSLLAFDHVIARVRLDGRNYWLDPTRTHQRGDLDTLYQHDYDYALVVAKPGGGLLPMSEDVKAVHGKHVEERFDIRGGVDQPVAYRIVTEADHYYADSMREQLAQSNINALQQSYLNYTARYYPNVESVGQIQVEEAAKRNALKVFESYRIPNAWEPMPESSYVLINFEPYLINDHISDVDSPKRTMPYAVTHPVRYRHTTRILVPEGSEFENESYEINDSAFRFVKSVEFDGAELVIDYLYESLRDHVIPADIEQHAVNLRDLYHLTSYQIRMVDPAIGFGDYHFAMGDVNWLMVGVALLTVILSGLLSYRFIYLYDAPARPPEAIDPQLVGLSGWLILPAISLFLFPFSVAWGSKDLLYIFSAAQWSVLIEEASVALMTLIIVEAVLNIVMIVLSLFLIAMFVTRRRGFPKLFIGFYLFVTIFSGGDLLALYLFSIPGIEVEATDIRDFIRLMFYTILWSVYFIQSKRVKATFTRSRDGKEPQWRGDPATQT